MQEKLITLDNLSTFKNNLDTINFSPLETRLDDVEQDLSTDTATVTGNPLNFSTRSAQKANKTVISLAPIQDLHGYDHPWPAGGGKNKLPMTVAGIKAANTDGTWNGNVYTLNNVTFELLTDSASNIIGIKVNGTSNNITHFIIGSYSLTAGEYTLNGCPNGGSSQSYYQDWRSDNGTQTLDNGGIGSTIITNGQSGYNVRIVIANSYNAQNLTFYPMIRLASITDPTFAPYSNYCPIDGRTEMSLVGTNGKESTDPDYIESNDLTIQFGEKVYGGTLDVENGELVVDKGYVIYDGSSDENWSKYSIGSASAFAMTIKIADMVFNSVQIKIIAWSNMFRSVSQNKTWGDYNAFISNGYNVNDIICGIKSITTLEDWKSYLSTNNLQVVYELATPRTITLTPNEISLLTGVNNISTDGDGITLTYRDGKVATLGDLEDTANNLQEQIDQNETMKDETTQLLYKLGVNNGLLFMEEV